MSEDLNGKLLPAQLQRIVAFALTVSGAILYAAIMTVVIVGVIRSPDYAPNENIVRAVGLLGGLVGAVVAAGFARSQPASNVLLGTEHPLGGEGSGAWYSIRPSRTRRNLLGLAELMGLPTRRAVQPTRTGDVPDAAGGPDDVVVEPPKSTTAMWVAILYLVVYLAVGLASLLVSLFLSRSPEIITQAAWVWIGTALSSAYAFFGIDRKG